MSVKFEEPQLGQLGQNVGITQFLKPLTCSHLLTCPWPDWHFYKMYIKFTLKGDGGVGGGVIGEMTAEVATATQD